VFGRDAVWKLRGEAKTGREIFFALYQAIGETGGAGIFRDYPPDYFDLIVVDECHRGSARDESSWRGILEHFAPATQLGMTATPLRGEGLFRGRAGELGGGGKALRNPRNREKTESEAAKTLRKGRKK
jgi:superfamily II DNA or RNA helicase